MTENLLSTCKWCGELYYPDMDDWAELCPLCEQIDREDQAAYEEAQRDARREEP